MTITIWKSMRFTFALCTLALAGLLVNGCGTPSSSIPEARVPGVEGDTNAATTTYLGDGTNPYVFEPGDTIVVTYYDVPGMVPPQEVEIRPNGSITLLLNQEFKAAGLTAVDLEKTIRERYVPNYYRQMTVTVRPKTDTRFYYVGGEVRSPGRQIYLSKITVSKAIQSAGDFTDFGNRKKVQLTRSGATKQIIVNCAKALKNPTLDLEVFPGDKIHVPRKIW
jgi:protein involved in polysaccharide export with SLBB domain